MEDKPHPREVKTDIFTVLLPPPRNCTLIITEKYIKSLNTTTGRQVEEKNSFLFPHALFCFRGRNTYSCWLGKETSSGVNQATFPSHFSSWSDQEMRGSCREPCRSLLPPPTAPFGACRATLQGIIHLGTGGANLQ